MKTIKFSIAASADQVEPITNLFEQFNAISITYEDAGSEELFQISPEDIPLWQAVKVSALFPADISTKEIIHQFPQQYRTKIKLETVSDQDWVRLTQAQFQPQCYNHILWICPSWHFNASFSEKTVQIDPGLSFGTGTHPTTAMCLEWLSQHNLNHQIIVDYGCGSGILGLAALALNAQKVYAVDHDKQARQAAKNNALLNHFVNSDNFLIYTPEQFPELQADIIIANILANPLIELAPLFLKSLKPQGRIVLSGLLETEIQKIIVAYQPSMKNFSYKICDGWAMIEFSR